MSQSTVFATTNDGEIEIVPYTEDCWEDTALALERFYQNETACIGTEVALSKEAQDELNILVKRVILDGASLVAREVSTGRVVGCMINVIQSNDSTTYEDFLNNDCKNESAYAFTENTIEVDALVDWKEIHNAENYLELMFLAVLIPEYANRGIGTLLMSASLTLARGFMNGDYLDLVPEELHSKIPTIATAICTSKYSLRIMQKLGCQTHLSISNDNFFFHGKSYGERINDPTNNLQNVVSIVL